jgi:hypothetical protein
MAQLASPMESNKRLIIQSSLAPKDYIHMRFAMKGTGEKIAKLQIRLYFVRDRDCVRLL